MYTVSLCKWYRANFLTSNHANPLSASLIHMGMCIFHHAAVEQVRGADKGWERNKLVKGVEIPVHRGTPCLG